MVKISRKDSKGRRLRDGETERKDGRYVYRFTDEKTGKRKNIYARDLAELRKKVKEEIGDGKQTDPATKKLTLNDLFDSYLTTKKVAPTTKVSYISIWNNHVRDELGIYKVTLLQKSDVEEFYLKMDEKGYSHSTIELIHNLLKPTLEKAVDDKIIDRNPVKCLPSNFGKPKEESIALTVEQQSQLMKFVKHNESYKVYYSMIAVMLGTGIRCGELIGLTWDDVDMKNKEININHQLQYKNLGDGYKFHVRPPKTDYGKRNIPMPSQVYDAFMQRRRLNEVLRCDKTVSIGNCKNFVFVNQKNEPFTPSSVNRILRNIVNAYNSMENLRQNEKLPAISAHTMRHTFCTRMVEKVTEPIQLKYIQLIMGHSDLSITLQIYTHITNVACIKKDMEKFDLLEI